MSGRNPVQVGDALRSDDSGVTAYIETLRRRLDANEAEIRALRASLQQRQADLYTGGQTEEQRKAMQ
jgi:multidrug resistance efflux pump